MLSVASSCKLCAGTGLAVRFTLRDTYVLECNDCGGHFLPVLDDVDTPDTSTLDDAQRAYIANELESNPERFPTKVDLLADAVDLRGARCLDVGAGGGLFLSLMQARGAVVDGVEPIRSWRQFAKERYGFDLRSESIERALTPEDDGAFDVVTAWDVIEHVNDPYGFMKTMVSLTAPGGIVAFDTPAREGLLYRLGTWEHDLTRGRSARLMRAMYSPEPFCHKQILRRQDLRRSMTDHGMVEVDFQFITELTFPTVFYLRHIFRSDKIARALDHVARRVMPSVPLNNKVVGVFRRPAA